MTATVYVSVRDDELSVEDEGGKVRVVVGNFAWTFVLEDRLDCARWAKAIADADALFIKRSFEDVSLPGLGEGSHRDDPGSGDHVRDDAGQGHPDDGYVIDIPLPEVEYTAEYVQVPVRTPALLLDPDCRDGKHTSCVGGPCDCACHEPGGTTYPQLSEEALAGQVPLGTLAPEPEEDEEAQA